MRLRQECSQLELGTSRTVVGPASNDEHRGDEEVQWWAATRSGDQRPGWPLVGCTPTVSSHGLVADQRPGTSLVGEQPDTGRRPVTKVVAGLLLTDGGLTTDQRPPTVHCQPATRLALVADP